MTAARTRKAPAKKAPTKKAPAKQASAERAPAEQAPAKKTAKRSAAKKTASAPRAESRPRAPALEVAATAGRQLAQLVGKEVEGVTGVERDEDVWRISVEMLELRRIPETTDVLGLYEVEADEKGNVLGYRRQARYSRGVARED